MILIKNAHILTMDAELNEIENGFIAVTDGKISAVGNMADMPVGDFDTVLDAKGAIVTPGLIDAHSHIGMWEDSLNFEGADGNEETDPITPHLRAIDAVNPMDKAFSEAAAAGITTVVTGPGSANPIAGQLMAMKTVGVCVDKMAVLSPAAIKFAFGENPKCVYNDKGQTPTTRMAVAAQIREELYKAKEYLGHIEKYNSGDEDDMPDFDIKHEALLPLLKKEIPMHAHAHRADDIFTAIRIAREFELDLVLVHATEGYMIADELKENGYPVLAGPILTDRSKPELKNQNEANAALLTKAGIETAIITDHPETPQRHLALCASVAARYGLSKAEALRSITYLPAKICGIADRVGRITVGCDADIVVWNGFPLEIDATPSAVMVDGCFLTI